MKVFVIAGEASGDRLGADLMVGLRTLSSGVDFSGVGGPLMAQAKLTSLFPMSDLSVMGLAEVLPRLPKLLRRIRQTVDGIVDAKPDVLITIDSPDFCLRVAERAKAEMPDLKTIHYVAPSVWAWRPERAEKMARFIDHVLALLPFEPPYMQAAGMTCDFVGHPAAADPIPSAKAIDQFRASLDIAKDTRILTVLPGSRGGEIKRMMPVFKSVIERVFAQHSDVQLIVPAAASVASDVVECVQSWRNTPIVLDPRQQPADQADVRKRTCFAASTLALATSGTVSLELAATATPMVIAYRANWLTTRMIKRMVTLNSATLVNLVTETLSIPEFLLDQCQPTQIADCVNDLLASDAKRTAQLDVSARAMANLGRGGEAPGLRAAKSVMQALG